MKFKEHFKQKIMGKQVEVPEYFTYEIEFILEQMGIMLKDIDITVDLVVEEIHVTLYNKLNIILDFEYLDDCAEITNVIYDYSNYRKDKYNDKVIQMLG